MGEYKIYSTPPHLPHAGDKKMTNNDVIMVEKEGGGHVIILPDEDLILIEDANGQQAKINRNDNNKVQCGYKKHTETSFYGQLEYRDGNKKINYISDNDNNIVIDLFAGFSVDSAKGIGDYTAFALAQIETVNQALRNYQVEKIRIRLVGTGITGKDHPITIESLDRLHEFLGEEAKECGADLIAAFFIGNPNQDSAIGWAYLDGITSINNISSATCFRHEVGHNAGGDHCPEEYTEDYYNGWNNGNVGTIMCGNNIGYYSNPEINDNHGTPIGDFEKADMARRWREIAYIMSAYAPSVIPFDDEKKHQIILQSVSLTQQNNFNHIFKFDISKHIRRIVINAVPGPRYEETGKITLYLKKDSEAYITDYDYKSRTHWTTFIGLENPLEGNWSLLIDSERTAVEDIIITVNEYVSEQSHPYQLQNPSAETGDLEGWEVIKGIFRVITTQDGIYPFHGNYYFTARDKGNFDGNTDQIRQQVSLFKPTVQRGDAIATLSFMSNGWGDGDYGEVKITALSDQGDELAGSFIKTPGKYNQWIENTVSLEHPPLASLLQVDVIAYRISGEMSDVHYDDFQLIIERNIPETIQNPSAETGDLTGWDTDLGEFRVVTTQDGIYPTDGNYFFTARERGAFEGETDQISQEVKINGALEHDGKTIACLSFQSNGWGDGDYGLVSLTALNENGQILKSEMVKTIGTKQEWIDYEVSLLLPKFATSLLIKVTAIRITGTMSDVHFDNFNLYYK